MPLVSDLWHLWINSCFT